MELGKDILVGNNDGKPVHLENLRQEVKDAFPEIVGLWKNFGLPAPDITSGNDRVHPGQTDCSTEENCRQIGSSLHYENLAIDLRSKNIPKDKKQSLVYDLKKTLEPKGYHVRLDCPGQADEDIHVQYNSYRTRAGLRK